MDKVEDYNADEVEDWHILESSKMMIMMIRFAP